MVCSSIMQNVRSKIGSLLVEGAFIVVSVLLGFAVAQYGEGRADRQLAHRALKVRPPLPPQAETDTPLVRRAAWDAAVTSGALRLIDYDLIASLSEIYEMQDHLAAAARRTPMTTSYALKLFLITGTRMASITSSALRS